MMVLILPEVRQSFYELSHILYEKNYFGFLDSAKRYVEELFADIKKDLPIKLHKPAPRNFDKYGKEMEYAVFKKSRQTSWYVFFTTYNDNGEVVYLIRYIANNHTVAQYL